MDFKNGKFKVSYIRDGLVEEFHEGICVSDTKRMNINNNIAPYYLRSCAKPLQATLLLDNNIDLSEKELTLCCASHAGEDIHIKIAKKLLDKFDIDESFLKCGIHSPLSRTMQDKMLLNNELPSQLHNNCSGKHIGFLILCKINNWSMADYYLPKHPLQLQVKNKINELCNVKEVYPMTTDGCGVPIVSMPLKNLTIGFKNLQTQYPKIIHAIKNNPYIFGGENRLDTEIIKKSEDLIAKVGAGGLCVVLNFKTKESFAVKINDASMVARRIAVLEIINQLGWAEISYDNKIKTISGKEVGEITVSFNV